MNKHKDKTSGGRSVVYFVFSVIGLGVVYTLMLRGTDIVLFNPKGQVASEQLRLFILSAGVLFGIAVPTIALMYRYAWKYRETNTSVKREESTKWHRLAVFSMWMIPMMIFVLLSVVMWSSTQRLEPQKAIASPKQPLPIQVIAMQWKWLFIYPEQQIATVNFVQIPKDTPVRFYLTGDEAPMSSFWIPHLAGQLYAMTGHVNPLNLVASSNGDYQGRSAEINGSGFADMKFTARVSTQKEFETWLQDVRLSGSVLDSASYMDLLEPSEKDLAAYYSSTEAGLFDSVLKKYNGSHSQHKGNE